MRTVRSRKPLMHFTSRERRLAWLWVGQWVAVAGAMVAGALGAFGPNGSKGMNAAVPFIFGGGGLLFLTGFLYMFAKKRAHRLLVERDFLACPYCAYDLRGVELPGVCPECGEAASGSDQLRRHWEQAGRYSVQDLRMSE